MTQNAIMTGRSDAMLRQFIEQAPAAMAMFDKDMVYLAVSERWKQDNDLTADPVGLSHYAVFPELSEYWKAIHRRAMAGETVQAEREELIRADGSTQWLTWVIRPWRQASGEVGGIMSLTEDITERVRAELTLRDSEARAREMATVLRAQEARLQSILVTVPDAMIVIDDKGLIQSFSHTAETLFGYASDEVLGRNVGLLMPKVFRQNHDRYMERYLETGVARIIGIGRVVRGERKDGSSFPLELQVGEVKLEEGRQFTGFIRDLTTRLESERRFQELQSELLHVGRVTEMGQMASALAHELNQPLAAVSNYLSGASRVLEKGDTATALSALAQARDQVARAGEIIRRLREFVRKGDSARKAENVVQMVEDACALSLVSARNIGVARELAFDPAVTNALVDKVQIQQVLVNLIRNAIEAMEHGPRRELTITTRAEAGDMVEIAVADTGTGLAPEIRQTLFQPFVTSKTTGMGIGLSLSRTIVEAHGGRLWAEDNADVGATFRFTFRTSPAAGAGGGGR